MIELPDERGERVRQRIVDLTGKVVLQEAGDLPFPVQMVRQPIVVRGETVAWLEAETTQRPLLVSTGLVAVVSSVLGLLAWLTVRLLPLRVLDQTLLRLSTESARFQAALDNMTQGLCLFDARHRLVVHNRRFVAMFGAPAAGAAASGLLPGHHLGRLFVPPDPQRPDEQDGGTHELADGRVIQISRQAVAGEGWVATFEDVTERKRSGERLSHMARHDALTGLPNRVLFREHMERVLPRLRRGEPLAVLCLDLDGFKGVNDTLGHPAGDELLRAVSRRLRDSTRETDLVARLGGDEFAIVQVGAEQPQSAAALADRLVEALREPFDLQGQWVEIGTSIGVVLADEGMGTADELLRNGDIALYRAKAAGRGTWRLFEPEMDTEIQKRRQAEIDLRRAIAEEQFEVHYQPLIEARGGVLTGFEALLRWHHPERGMISPAEFIPLAEEIGLIRAIGAWVLRKACADAAGWPGHVRIAINLSPVQFVNGHLVQEVEQALASAGLAASRLELEITESVLLQDNDATLGVLHRLHDLGVRISMDDFGTGYSSLSYLRRFPFDKIKIDQSFVRNLGGEKGSIEIIRAVVGLGKALGMNVLAEGVETAEQRGILEVEGCDELQGYLFSQPRPVRDVPAIIAAHPMARDAAARGPLLVVDNAGEGRAEAAPSGGAAARA
ncbi:EAL domain-containing protein [Roseomonas nepalensis]|uniref:EAL domain-containing protein n=2 Tax=Muricoccus nepalensis TaxID=1854500 RepID=A0A502GFS9_9PROT|nr:EAL domain-containing protein [Roseomonas nepalensis]